MNKVAKNFLIDFEMEDQECENPQILRVTTGTEHTRIDFGYAAPWIYDRGGWIRIAPETYLQIVGSKKKFHLLQAINIPLAPEHHHFESTADWVMFSLLFEPLPLKDCQIDIIESEQPNDNDFNYYGIGLKCGKKIELCPL